MDQILLTGDPGYLKDIVESIASVRIVSPKNILDNISESEAKLIMLDMEMKEDIIELITSIRSLEHPPHILVYGPEYDVQFARMFLQLGAKGYVVNDAPSSEIINAVESTMRGGRYVSTRIENEMVNDALRGKSANPFHNLSKRELEILLLLLDGRSLTSIGESLSLKPTTVSTFKARIFNKMKNRSLAEVRLLAKGYKVV